MPKNIVFCADGTWNRPGKTDTSLVANTNVYKIFKAILISSEQISSYDDGVGSDGTPIDKLAGGAIGEGLFQKIKDGYTFIAHNYKPGDQIYIFGFSRGAYTARSLAGLIAICGLPEPSKFTRDAVDSAFQVYRARTNRDSMLEDLKQKYGNNTTNVEISMVGVWDTVGALGIPGDIFEGLDTNIYGFLDTSLHEDVKYACHALSIDEKRAEFVPTLWNQQPEGGAGRLDQVWFSGVHADVGGGYYESGLSSITLRWMIEKANSRGVKFDQKVLDIYMNIDQKHALDIQHFSWNPFWGFPQQRIIPDNATISSSVKIRIDNDPDYRPENLKFSSLKDLSNNYKIANVV
jgi:uncharacterized protein (DUF2235 family)